MWRGAKDTQPARAAACVSALAGRAEVQPPRADREALDGGVAGVAGLTRAAEDGEADSTLTLSPEALQQMIDGALDPTFAYMTGKLKISGSMGVALKLAAMLED